MCDYEAPVSQETEEKIAHINAHFKELTKLECFFIRCDENGEVPFCTGACNTLCARIAASKDGAELCTAKRGSLISLAIFTEQPVHSPCHAGLGEIVAPLFLGGKPYGVFVSVINPLSNIHDDLNTLVPLFSKRYNVDPAFLTEWISSTSTIDRLIIQPSMALLKGLIGVTFRYGTRNIHGVAAETASESAPPAAKPAVESIQPLQYSENQLQGHLLQMISADTASESFASRFKLIQSLSRMIYNNVRTGKIFNARVFLDEIYMPENDPGALNEKICNGIYCVILISTYIIELDEQAHKVFEISRRIIKRLCSLTSDHDLITVLEYFLNELCNVYQQKSEDRNAVVERILGYIEKSFNEPISLELIAKKIRISPSYASRLFKKEMGMNFKQYLIEVRMYWAYKYLCLTYMDKPIQEIAEMCGYTNIRAFYTMFNKYYGMTCSQMRQMFGKKENYATLPPHPPVIS